MKPTLEFITELATEAGKIVQSFVGEALNVQHKSRTDLVTKADFASEKYLLNAIQQAFPTHMINAEESGEWKGERDHQWYLDPLDGTLNYSHGLPIYCVSIGYAYQGEMTLGVVYDPTREEYFTAEKGKGAFLNGRPMQVSSFEALIDCMLVTGLPHDKWGTPEDNIDNFIRFSELSQAVRRLGSAALDMVYVAAGRLDGFWEPSIFDWDIAAGSLIVSEAGGVVTNVFGSPAFMKEPISVVCANPVIHAKMLEVLAEVRSEQEKNL